jgi:hypothetical protein
MNYRSCPTAAEGEGCCLRPGSAETIGRPAVLPDKPVAAATERGPRPPIDRSRREMPGPRGQPASRPTALGFLPTEPVSQPMGPVPRARVSQPKGPVPMGLVSQLKAAASHLTEPAAAKGPVSPPVGPVSLRMEESQPKGLASQQKVPVSRPTAQAPVPLEAPVVPRQARQALSRAESPPSSSQAPRQKMRLPAAAGGCRSWCAGTR